MLGSQRSDDQLICDSVGRVIPKEDAQRGEVHREEQRHTDRGDDCERQVSVQSRGRVHVDDLKEACQRSEGQRRDEVCDPEEGEPNERFGRRSLACDP